MLVGRLGVSGPGGRELVRDVNSCRAACGKAVRQMSVSDA